MKERVLWYGQQQQQCVALAFMALHTILASVNGYVAAAQEA